MFGITPAHIERILEWRRGNVQGPWTVILFPTMRCNLRCRMCFQPWHADTSHELSDERLLRLVDESADLGVQEWVIVGGGEPTVRWKMLKELCRRVRKHGMHGTLFTNGTLFTPEFAQGLIDAQWDLIRVSLDGPNAEINDAIRSAGSFEKATEGLRLFRDLRKAQGAQYPLTGLHMTINQTNYDKVEDMLRLARELDCQDGVALSCYIENDPSRDEFALNPETLKKLPDLLHRASSLAAELGVIDNFEAFIDDRTGKSPVDEGLERVGLEPGDLARVSCFEPWLTAAINADGLVGPCCAFKWSDEDSVSGMSLKEAWLGPRMQQLRLNALKGRYPGYCRDCPQNLVVRNFHFRDSVIQAAIREVRSQWTWKQSWRDLLERFGRSLRKNGVRGSMRRGWEWWKLYGMPRKKK